MGAENKTPKKKGRLQRQPNINLTNAEQLELLEFIKANEYLYNKEDGDWLKQKDLQHKWDPICQKLSKSYQELKR